MQLDSYVTMDGHRLGRAMEDGLALLGQGEGESITESFERLIDVGFITPRQDELFLTIPGLRDEGRLFARRILPRDLPLLAFLDDIEAGTAVTEEVLDAGLLLLAVYSMMGEEDDPEVRATDEELLTRSEQLLAGLVVLPGGPAKRIIDLIEAWA